VAQRGVSARTGVISRIALRAALLIGLAVATVPTQTCGAPAPADSGLHAFQGIWTAVGQRTAIGLGDGRRASIAEFSGSLMMTGPARPDVGFRANVIVLNDSVTGLTGRAAWTDEHGDRLFSELRGDGRAQDNRIFGTFVGGSGRYAGATGSYQFAWRFLLEGEDGAVQGQSVGLAGQLQLPTPAGRPPPRPAPR
jgi:hypothetical protein